MGANIILKNFVLAYNEETKYIFFIKYGKLIEKHNEIWNKVGKVIKKGFDSETLYNDKYLETKIKSYEEKVNTIFYNDKMPKEDSHCIG